MMLATERPDPSRTAPPPHQQRGDEQNRAPGPLGIGDARPLTILLAPTGYGKTACLADCFHREAAEQQNIGWLALEREEADPDQLAASLCRALAGWPAPSCAPSAQAILPRERLADMLDGTRMRVDGAVASIFLDDFDKIAGTAGARFVAELVGRYHKVRWVVATRIVPLHDFARLRAHGLVLIVDGTALRLPRRGYSTILGRAITAQEEERIEQVVGGWPLALRALKSELDSGCSIADGLSRIGTADSLVGDYVVAELLPSLPSAAATVLSQASILGEFDAPMVDLLCERKDSHQLLSSLGRLGPLAVRGPTGAWRLHPLVRQHLEHCLDRQPDIDLAKIRMAAFELLAERGDYIRAIKNALKGGGARAAAALIGRVGIVRLWTELGFSEMLDIVRMLPPALGAEQPSLRFCEPLGLYDCGRTTSALRLLDTIRSDVFRDFRSDRNTTARFDIEWIAIRTIINLVREVIREEDLNRLPIAAKDADSSFADIMSFVNTLLWAVAHQQWGELDQADRMVSLAEQSAPPKSPEFNGYFFGIYRGWIASAQGEPSKAIDGYRRMWNADQVDDLRCLGEVMVAEALYMQGDFAAASDQIDSWLLPLEQSQAWFDFLSAGYVTAAFLSLRNKGLPAGLAIVERMQIVARDRQAPALARLVPALKLSLLMRAGAIKTARSYEAEHQLGAACRALPQELRGSSWRERDLLRATLAEFYIHSARTKEARQCIQLLLEDAEATGRPPARLTALLLRSALIWRHGNRGSAIALLARVIEEAVVGDQRGLVWDREHLIVDMLEQMRRERPDLTPGARLLAETIIAYSKTSAKSGPNPLSPRERQVLTFVEAGNTNKQIARHLKISENTVKFHIKRIAVKLDRVGRGRASLASAGAL